jgi:hypothetical protein
MELSVMKKILLVLAMIAASVFLAQPAVAEGETGGDTVAATETTPDPTPEVVAEEPPPVVEQEPAPAEPAAAEPAPAEPAPAEPAPAEPAPADPAPADPAAGDSAGDAAAGDTAVEPTQEAKLIEAAPSTDEEQAVAAAGVKSWVCKYVGTPNVDERYKDGKNPISVSSVHPVGTFFEDSQGRSYVLAVDDGGPAPPVTDCPTPVSNTEVTTEAPIVSDATCDSDGALTLPDTTGVLYTVTPNYTGDPGTYDVVATALPGYVLSANSVTEWNDLVVGEQLTEGCNQDVKKVWVCKYVGKPGVDEVLKGGKNPIEVSVNALPGSPDNPQVGDQFVDAQERSVVVALSPADPEPTVEDCLPPIQPTEVTPEPPTADPATCEADGSLNVPETEGVVYTVDPDSTGPGDYVVTATPESDAFVLIGDTVFEITVDSQLALDKCVKDEGEEDEDANELLPATGGLPLWILLLAGPMTAAGLLVLMRRQPVDQSSTSGRMPSYTLILPPAKKPAGVKRAHASTQHIGLMKAVGNVVAAIGSFFRGGRH